MFQRVILESWHDYVPYICFALIGGSFLAIVIRAAFMKPEEVGRLAAMPLIGDEELEKKRKANPDEDSVR
ncbi:MAG: hypothetical protein GXX91_08730 [Verrucomicrobiaceae bacterium]|nr:hypothetical protein [Verrucomicrobiaceae bacterium]